MALSNVKIHFPSSVVEAAGLLETLPGARMLAGGTDLLVDLKQGTSRVTDLISAQNLDELRGIKNRGDTLWIGAMTTPAELAASRLIRQRSPALAEAAGMMASPHIRSMATVGGNVASAVPSADLPPSFIADGASVELLCSAGSREVPLSEFFTGPRATVCGSPEILTGFLIPPMPKGSGASFQRFSLREANALALVSCAVRLFLDGEIVRKAVIVLGAVAPVPMIAGSASASLSGKPVSAAAFDRAAALAGEESRPISDVRGTARFRRDIARVLVRRALDLAARRVLSDRPKGKRNP